MYQAYKIGLKSPRPDPVSLQRGQIDAALAADYKLSPVSQVTLDRNGCICRINVAAAVLLKGEPAQLISIPFIAFVDKAYCRLFLDHIAESFGAGKRISTRLALSAATRAVGPVELQSTSGIDTATGRVLCRTAIITFSPGRRAGVNDLSRDESGYQEWFELFPDAAILELGGKVVSANAGALKLLGAKSSDEIQGEEILGIIHP